MAGFDSAAGTIQFTDTAGNNLTGPMNVVTGFVWPFNPDGWLATASGAGLNLVSATGAFNGTCEIQYGPG
jgi:hypothetical protein